MNCLKRGVGFEEAVLFDRWDSRVGNREYGFVSFFFMMFLFCMAVSRTGMTEPGRFFGSRGFVGRLF